MEALAAVAVFASVFLLFVAIGGRNRNVARERLDSLTRPREGAPGDAGVVAPLTKRVVSPAFGGMARAVSAMLPRGYANSITKNLALAGSPMALSGFLSLQALSLVAFGFLGVILVSSGGGLSPMMTIAVLVTFGMGFYLPHMWLKQRVGARQKAILQSLPDAFDLVTVCVEAGLGLDAALARVSERVEGPFGEELSRTLREIALGKMRKDALKEMGERTGVADLQTFVNAVIQAEQIGSSIGQVLRVQSDQLRLRRRQRAEEQAYKAPVKMIFPLVLCIFPTLFIVILGPAAIAIMRDMGGR